MDRDGLCTLIREKLNDYPFLVVSNREPYIHTYSGRKIEINVPASGLTTALDPVMQACGGTWIAHGGGDADKEVVDKDNKVQVPADNPRYALKRVWLSKEDVEGYYYGFANQALWPLCHIVYVKPKFNEVDWNTYKRVNEMFARAVLDEVRGRSAFVFIQDYHLALLPQMIKEQNKNIITAQFWHIPWPNPEAFRICPWKEEILQGLLGNDVMGFHIHYHCNNFLDTVDRTLESRVDRERYEVVYKGKKTAVRHYPISVDFEALNQLAQSPEVTEEMARLRNVLGLTDELIGVGFDRLDYTKGIPERLRTMDRFLERFPEYKGRVVFLQAGVPSREHIAEYRQVMDEIDDLVREINYKYGQSYWKPIIYMREHLSPISLMALRRLANFFIVNPLHDGMNLVAKEFIAGRFDEDGVLLLSPFIGAARELTDALQVNPYAIDEFAGAVKLALEMPRSERQKRMRRMREIVKENNIYKWAGDIMSDLVKLEAGD